MHCDINPPPKNNPLFLAKRGLNLQTVQAHLSGNPPLLCWFFKNHPPKSHIFQWTPKILYFFILNQSYLLKVTKFLVKFSKFHFLVMIEKNIFIYKLFLNISDFSLFFMQKLNPLLKKVSPLVPCNPALKVEVLSVQLFNNFVAGSTPLAERGECTLWQSK